MKKKFLAALSAKCKSYGLTEKALEEISEIGASGLTEEATDEEIAAKVDSLVPFAKAMQAEITRKTMKPSKKSSNKTNEEDEEGNGEENEPAWMKKYAERLDAIEQENKSLKAEKAATERASLIAKEAKKLGIPEFLVKHLSFADDADIASELTNFKQELVNNSLVPKSQAHETGNKDESSKADADAWAKSLPDKQ